MKIEMVSKYYILYLLRALVPMTNLIYIEIKWDKNVFEAVL